MLATPVMNEAETMALGGPVRNTGTTRTVPAGVAGQGQRDSSKWWMAVLAALGVLAVVALVVGVILTNRSNEPQVQQVAVPDLTGQSEDQAKTAISAAGLVPAAGEVVKDDCEKGQVADWSSKGLSVDPGTTVTYRMCAGPDQVPIPRLVGLTEPELRQYR